MKFFDESVLDGMLHAEGTWHGKPFDAIRRFSNDTRTIEEGDCFVAIKTGMRDGHDFLEVAREKGAVAALVSTANTAVNLPQRVVKDPLKALQSIAKAWRTQLALPIIGVTGSCGKTSTKDLLQTLLGIESTFKTESNLNNTLGVPLMLTRIDPRIHKAAVIEAGINQVGEMSVLADMIQPDIGLVTIVAPVHLEGFKSEAGVAFEKARLLQAVKPSGLKIMPASACHHEAFKALEGPGFIVGPWGHGVQKVGFRSIEFTCQHLENNRMRLSLFEEGRPMGTFTPRFVGSGMTQNMVMALIVGLELGVPEALLNERLTAWTPSDLRGQVFEVPGQWIYADCYNANPASMREALSTFEAQVPAQLPRLYILGGMLELGPQAALYHVDLADAFNPRPQDTVILVGEHMPQLKAALVKRGHAPERVHLFDSTEVMQPWVQNFQGALFLKGSKGFHLWTLLPDHLNYS